MTETVLWGGIDVVPVAAVLGRATVRALYRRSCFNPSYDMAATLHGQRQLTGGLACFVTC